MTVKRVYKSEITAKINLSLEITGKFGNMHTLKMLVCPYKGYKDGVEFYPIIGKRDVEVEIASAYDGLDNARFLDFFIPRANAIATKLGVGGILAVAKGVPLGAGLGGSSASVAAALDAMRDCAEELGKNIALDSGFLLSLGSDVPCMLYGKPCVVYGVGEEIVPVEIPFDTECFKVEIAKGGSDTAACYALYDKLKSDGNSDTSSASGESENNYISTEIQGEKINLFKNDLTLPACILNKNIQNLILKLKMKSDCVFLSGSGSAVVFKINKL